MLFLMFTLICLEANAQLDYTLSSFVFTSSSYRFQSSIEVKDKTLENRLNEIALSNDYWKNETLSDFYNIINKRSIEETGFDAWTKKHILDLHNLYRSNVTPPTGNMAFMEWDDELAKLGKEWADECIFDHSIPNNLYPDTIGQNLYWGPDPTGTEAMWMFYEERYGYNYRNQTCSVKMCGHYTQLIWASSTRIGCGIKKCNRNNYHLVCHYSPAGNVQGDIPYEVSKPCSQCPVPGSLCYRNMCLTPEQCERHPELCEKAKCELECHNCGRFNQEKCTCECADGWDSPDCSRPCIDRDDNCGKKPGWPNKYFCSLNDNRVETHFCRKMCQSCHGINVTERFGNVCCEGIICPKGQVLDLERRLCRCRILCPGLICHSLEEESEFSQAIRLFNYQAVLWNLLLLYILYKCNILSVQS